MKRFLIFVALALPASAFADPAPIPQAFDIRLDQQQLATIEKALVKLPYEEAAPLLQNLSKQIHDQADPAKPAEEKK